MRFIRLQSAFLALSFLMTAGVISNFYAPVAHAQTLITGDIVGIVSDRTGAFITGAKVTVTNQATGITHVVTTGTAGEYRVSQLPPGNYSVVVAYTGFEKFEKIVTVSPNSIAPANATLSVGKATETVEVSGGEVALLHVDDPQLTTSFTTEQIESLPNPGNDMTFIAQTSAGAVMNTQAGYGNFSVFGLPATANTFTINGGYDNDPFLNVNNSGATNLLLGQNDVGSVTVTTNAYNAAFGGLGGAQVSQTSRSGGNKFHGNAAYWWNGRVMNANDFFNKNPYTSPTPSPRAFDNANQYAAAAGGPIKRDKAFFFVNFEGLKVVLPSRSTVYAPDPTYQSTVLSNLVANGMATTSTEYKVYENVFNLYNNAPSYSKGGETPGCGTAPYCTWTFNGTAGNYTHEWLLNPRIDLKVGSKDNIFAHGTIDKGLQATYTSVLNPLYNAASVQPSYEAQIGETHTFSSTLSNQFLFSTIYYVAVFSNANEAASEDTSTGGVPFSLIFANSLLANNTAAGFPGGYNMIWPQGRNVTGYNFGDDLSWVKGKHTISIGWAIRRDDVTDYSPSEFTTSPEAYTTAGSFQQGFVDLWFEQFPSRPTQPVALYAMGWYGQDQWKIKPNFTLTYGLRMEHNSNPLCRTNCFAHLNGSFANSSPSIFTPYDSLISYRLNQAMPNLQAIGWEPRVGFAYLPFGAGSKTTIRGGFGMFSDAFPGVIADDLLNNAPTNVPFTIYGPAFGGGDYLLIPGATSTNPSYGPSSQSIAAASYAGFASNFYPPTSGSLYDISLAVPSFAPPGVVNPALKIKYPTYEEWSLAIEHQVGRFDSFRINYVGNHTYHGPVLNNGINAWNSGDVPGFPELSTSSAPNPNFGGVNEISSASVSNYSGLVVSAEHRSKNVTATVNYVWSHALDEISNGGFEGFSGNSVYPDNPFNLRSNYGNADYDTRHYLSASYVYTMPHYKGPKLLVDNWQVSGTAFHTNGYPFSVIDGLTATGLSNYGGPLFAEQVASISGHTHCGGNSPAQGTPCLYAGDYDLASDFGQSRRNQLYGPNYTDFDFTLTKGFVIPSWQSAKFRVGAQFFNVFNHPNFAQPYNNFSAGSAFGTITAAVNPPTSILGSFLGGDASPRLIQVTAKFDF